MFDLLELLKNLFRPIKRQILNYLFNTYVTPKKFANILLYLICSGNSVALNYPSKLTICPGNICNINCVLCPAGRKDKGRKIGLMDIETYRKILDECGPYLYEIDLFNWGEPLLNKNLIEMIKYAKKHKIKVNISTNLNYYDDHLYDELIHSKLDTLMVSLDGASQESANKYQKGNDFEKVMNNMKKIVERKKALKRKHPIIQWRFIVNKYNEGEIGKARELSEIIGVDALEVQPIRCDMMEEILLNNENQFNNIQEWLPDSEGFSMYSYESHAKKNIKSGKCDLLWSQSTINWDGSVSPCCAIWYEKFDFGNIKNERFKSIWNNEKYKDARKASKSKAVKDLNNICYICGTNKAQL